MLPLYREKRTGEDKREAVCFFFLRGGMRNNVRGGGGYNDETREVESQTETVKERQRKGGVIN